MAGPVIESISSSDYVGAASDMAITKPSGTVSGDLLVCIQFSGNGSNRHYNAGSTGFTLDDSQFIDSSQSVRVFYKIAGGSEPSSYTFTRNDDFTTGRGFLFRISGAEDPTTTPFVHATASINGSGGNSTFPDISPTNDDSLVLRTRGITNSGSTSTPPTGHVEEIEENNTGWSMSTYSKTEPSGSTGTYAVSYLPAFRPAHPHACVAIAPVAAVTGDELIQSRQFISLP